MRESGTPSHWRQLVEVLQQTVPKHKSALGPVLHEISRRIKRRGVVVLLSDLLGDVDQLLAGLKHLRHQRHEVIVLQTLDPAEIEFPFERTTKFQGLESLPEVLAEPRTLRKAYTTELHKFLQKIEVGCRSQQIDYELLRTDLPFDETLRRFLTKRTGRKKQ